MLIIRYSKDGQMKTMTRSADFVMACVGGVVTASILSALLYTGGSGFWRLIIAVLSLPMFVVGIFLRYLIPGPHPSSFIVEFVSSAILWVLIWYGALWTIRRIRRGRAFE